MVVFPSDLQLRVDELPVEIPISGIPMVRLRYVYEKIREYVSDGCKDILCPVPDNSDEDAVHVSDEPQPSTSSRSVRAQLEVPASTGRKCGYYCGESGHQNRV